MFEKPAFQKIRIKKKTYQTIGGKTKQIPPKETQLVFDFYHDQTPSMFNH
jgi:hypothetical protein